MSVLSFEDLEREIENIKDEFYSENGGKNMFFKKNQKYECAKQVVNKIPLELLLNRMCVNFENTNCIHVDYPIMKTFASPDNFEIISENIISNIHSLKPTYKTIEVFLNLDGFSVSAAERYKSLIEIFCKTCFRRNTDFEVFVNQFVLYNSPSAIDSIKHMAWSLMEESIKKKVVILQKKDSFEIASKIMRLKNANGIF